jgi:hypothetical protein
VLARVGVGCSAVISCEYPGIGFGCGVAIGRVGGLAFPFLRLVLLNPTIHALDTDCMISGVQFVGVLR